MSAARLADAGQPGAFAAGAVELRRLGLFPLPLGGEDGKQPQLKRFTTMRMPSLETIKRWVERWPDANFSAC